MKPTVFRILIVFTLICQVANAQYCSTKEGTMFYYQTHDVSKGTVKTDSAKVIRVVETGDFIKSMVYNYTPESRMFNDPATQGWDCEQFVYRKSSGVTEHLYISEQAFRDLIKAGCSKDKPGSSSAAQAEQDSLDLFFKIKGDVMIPLSKHYTPDTPVADSRFSYKLGIVKMSMSVSDGKYLGMETITTPAGTFSCLKISYRARAKVMLFSEKVDMTEWYVEGIGLVRREERTTRGKLMETFELAEVK